MTAATTGMTLLSRIRDQSAPAPRRESDDAFARRLDAAARPVADNRSEPAAETVDPTAESETAGTGDVERGESEQQRDSANGEASDADDGDDRKHADAEAEKDAAAIRGGPDVAAVGGEGAQQTQAPADAKSVTQAATAKPGQGTVGKSATEASSGGNSAAAKAAAEATSASQTKSSARAAEPGQLARAAESVEKVAPQNPSAAGHTPSGAASNRGAELPPVLGGAGAGDAGGQQAAGSQLSNSAQQSHIIKADGPDVDPNVARVARGLQTALSQRGGAVTLRLSPPELGTVRVQVSVHDGIVRAHFQTQNDSVRTLLSHQIQHLRHALEGQGLNVERLEVQTQTNANHSQNAGGQGQREDAGQGRSRGQFAGSDQNGGGGDGAGRDSRDPPRRQDFRQALVNLVG